MWFIYTGNGMTIVWLPQWQEAVYAWTKRSKNLGTKMQARTMCVILGWDRPIKGIQNNLYLRFTASCFLIIGSSGVNLDNSTVSFDLLPLSHVISQVHSQVIWWGSSGTIKGHVLCHVVITGIFILFTYPMGLLPDMKNCGLRMRRVCRERFPGSRW